VVAAHAERERIATEISSLAPMVGRVHPGDVSRSKAEALVRSAGDLVMAGGEEPPRLKRDPREPRSGMLPEAEAVTAA
jgi:hypothetical protein